RDLVAHLGLARGDVDLGAGLDEAARDHEPDAARAAGHEGDLAVDGEEVRHRRHHAAAARGREGPVASGTSPDHYHARPSEEYEAPEWMRPCAASPGCSSASRRTLRGRTRP